MGSSYMSITYSYKLSRGFPRTIATFFRVGTFLQQHLAASGGMSLRSSSSTNSHLVNCFSLLISLFPFSKLHHLVHTIELKVFELQRKFEILAKGRIFMASFLHLDSCDSCDFCNFRAPPRELLLQSRALLNGTFDLRSFADCTGEGLENIAFR